MLSPSKRNNRVHVPMRTCVGCRARAAKSELIRVVLTGESEVAVDDRQNMPGRGAYVHRTEVCVSRAIGRGGSSSALGRSFRRRVSPPSQAELLSGELSSAEQTTEAADGSEKKGQS